MESTSQNQPSDTCYILPKLDFVNTAFKTFEIDENPTNKTREVPGYVYSKVPPTPLKNPRIGTLSQACLQMIGLDKNQIMMNEQSKKLYAELLCGNRLFEGSIPISHNYCGHQFGVFAGQLGDGRAITLGDVRNAKGETWELQLKGAGKTPYSRQADGRAVLRSSIREFLCSEAMVYLGVPTSRAASLIVSDSKVHRDPLYSGNVIMEKCAVVMRVAPTFFRFGSFEIFKKRDPYSGMEGPSHGMQEKMMPTMLDFLIRNYYPEIFNKDSKLENQTKMFFEEITKRTAELAAYWQTIGYVHGVLNTDNMSALGLTIDYGPYGFMEHYNPKFIPNYSDKEGRYSYENQPSICKWNLGKLAEALHPYTDQQESKKYLEDNYDKFFSAKYLDTMARKMGFILDGQPPREQLEDHEYECVQSVFEVMQETNCDFTNTFRTLANISRSDTFTEEDHKAISQLVKYSAPIEHVIAQKKSKYSPGAIKKIKHILETNPDVLLMFGLDPEQARKEIQDSEDASKISDLSQEEKSKKDRILWTKWVQIYKMSLSQADVSITDEKRKESMNKINPKFVLRNYLMEEAIKAAEAEDFSKVEELLKMCYDPYNEHNISDVSTNPPPQWAYELCVSCSS